MEHNIQLPTFAWRNLNFAWVAFFIIMGFLNIYIAYNFDTDTWVNFKFFGGLGLTVVFVVLQSVYLARHIIELKSPNKENSNNADITS